MKFRDAAFCGTDAHVVPIGAVGFVVFDANNVADVNGIMQQLLALQPSRFECVYGHRDDGEIESQDSHGPVDEPRPRRRGRHKHDDRNSNE